MKSSIIDGTTTKKTNIQEISALSNLLNGEVDIYITFIYSLLI